MTFEAGLHRDLPMDVYLGDEMTPQPALSASGIRTLIEATPLEFASRSKRLWPFPWEYVERGGTKSTRVGSALHAMLLEGTPPCVIRPADHLTKKGQPGKNLGTDGAKEAIAEAEANGIPWLNETQEIDAMRARDLGQKKILADPDFGEAWRSGEPEVTMIWQRAVSPSCPICSKPHEPIWCRGRIDWLAARHFGIMFDLKVTELSIDGQAVAYRFKDQGADLHAAWYQQGLEALWPEFAPNTPKFRLDYPWAASLGDGGTGPKRRALYLPCSLQAKVPYDCRFTPFPPETLDWLNGKIDIACDLFAHWLDVPAAKWPGWSNGELPSVRDYQIYKEMEAEAEEES